MMMFEHFVQAQDPVYNAVLEELTEGEKRSHWMWFIFPELKALGRSPMTKRFGLESLQDAQSYLAHPIVGPRLLECTDTTNRIIGKSAYEVFGSPDDLKFRSSMTLFAKAHPDRGAFADTLLKYYPDGQDPLTLRLVVT